MAGLKQVLIERGILKQSEAASFPAAFEQIGGIAIIEIPGAYARKSKAIARAILEQNKHIETVVNKTPFKGKYRVRRLKFLAGKKTTLASHRESDCVFEFDVAKVYFSPRLAYERDRIAQQAQNGEKIIALFAGVGPFPIIIAKKLKKEGKKADIIANELNPVACKYLKRNIELNKVGELVAIEKGDAAKILPKYRKWAGRIIMPLPHSGEKFLPQAIDATAKGGIVHFYGFGPHRDERTKEAANPFKKLEEKIKKICKKKKRKCRVVFKRVVRPYSPFSVQVVIDFKVQ